MIQIPEFEDLAEREPYLYEGLQKLISGVNAGFGKLGTDPAPKTDSTPGSTTPATNQATDIPAPLPPLAINVAAPKGVFQITLTANGANGPAVLYFVEYATDTKFSAPVPIPMGASLTASLNLGNGTTYYFRCRAKYAQSDYSPYLNFGSPTGLLGLQVGSSEQAFNTNTNYTNQATVDSVDAGSNATIRAYGAGGTPGITPWNYPVGSLLYTIPAGSITGVTYGEIDFVSYNSQTQNYQKTTAFISTLPDYLQFAGKVTCVVAGGGGGVGGGGGTGGGGGGRGFELA